MKGATAEPLVRTMQSAEDRHDDEDRQQPELLPHPQKGPEFRRKLIIDPQNWFLNVSGAGPGGSRTIQ